jgi:hypothetical protein
MTEFPRPEVTELTIQQLFDRLATAEYERERLATEMLKWSQTVHDLRERMERLQGFLQRFWATAADLPTHPWGMHSGECLVCKARSLHERGDW